jgi:BMFP domain-containing protein YqiC
MTQTTNRFFDEIGRLMNDAAGAAQGAKREFDTVLRNQAEKFLRDMDLVKREEFEVVKDMARLAREENEALKARITALEAKLGGERRLRRSLAFPWRGRGGARAGGLFSLSFPHLPGKSPPSSRPPHPWRLAANCAMGRVAAH